MKSRVFNLIIVDESGSMNCIAHQAITGVNETFNTIRTAQLQHPEQEQYVTFISFDSSRTKVTYDKAPIAEVNNITSKDYCPRAATPLYDVMGFALTNLRGAVERQDLVLVTIITDGYENASKEYSGKAIKALVDDLTKEDWVFSYIGANQDVADVASSLGISNHLEFKQDEEGTRAMFAKECNSRKRIMKTHHDFYKNIPSTLSEEDAIDFMVVQKSVLKENYFDE